MFDCVDFVRLDEVDGYLENAADKAAEFFMTYKNMLPIYCTLMRTNVNWQKTDYANHYNKWKSSVLGKNSKKAAPDKKQLVEVVLNLYDTCKNNKDIKKIRGLVPEKILEKIFEIRYKDNKYKICTGAQVIIKGNPVEYICSKPCDNGYEDSDKNKKTVDVGTWDGILGEFSEVKFSPEGFHTKDIRYLNILEQCLKVQAIRNNIYLIALDEKELIQSKLERLNLWDNKFILIGKNEVFKLSNFS